MSHTALEIQNFVETGSFTGGPTQSPNDGRIKYSAQVMKHMAASWSKRKPKNLHTIDPATLKDQTHGRKE